MQTYTASRFSKGNKVFPDTITIDDQCITLKIPALLSGNEKTLLYSGVSSVNILCPMIGFSSINITTLDGEVLTARGFTKKAVHQMKDFILSRI